MEIQVSGLRHGTALRGKVLRLPILWRIYLSWEPRWSVFLVPKKEKEKKSHNLSKDSLFVRQHSDLECILSLCASYLRFKREQGVAAPLPFYVTMRNESINQELTKYRPSHLCLDSKWCKPGMQVNKMRGEIKEKRELPLNAVVGFF